MTRTLLFTLTTAALLLAAGPATALDFCHGDKKCPTATTCHAGVCVPNAMLCKSDSTCAGYEICDFSCPHGVPVAVTEPAPGGGSSSSGSSGSAGSGETPSGSGSSGSSGSGSGGKDAEKGDQEKDGDKEGDKGGEDKGSGANTSSNTCPKDVGVCVVKFEKVVVDKACETFCKTAAKCDGLGTSGGSSGSAPSPGEPVETEPPQPGGDSGGEGGSSGSGGDTPTPDPDKGGDDKGDEDKGDGEKGGDDEKGGKEVPGGKETPEGKDDEDNKTQPSESDIEACAKTCTVIKLLKVAEKELPAAMSCVADAAKGDAVCSAIEKSCATQMEAVAKKLKDNDVLDLKLAGGWGGGGTVGSDAGTVNTGGKGTAEDNKDGTNDEAAGGATGQSSNNPPAGESSPTNGTTNSGSATGGCTAAGTGHKTTGGGLAFVLAMLALFAMRRRQAFSPAS